jgi:hypothetical protein
MRRLGALAGLAPSLLVVAWMSFGRFGTPRDLLLVLVTVAVVAVLAGWIVGSLLGSSTRSTLLGVVAYAGMAWVIYVPIWVTRSMWQRAQDGSLTDPAAVLVALVGPLAYGLVSSVWAVPLFLPLGAVWMITFRSLGRAAKS